MSAYYDEFIKRLTAYKKETRLSRDEVCKLSEITQKPYNKTENMNNKTTYSSLVVLNEKGTGVDFLVTGIEQKHTVSND